MSFLRKDDELLEKFINIWNKVSSSIKKWFDSEPLSCEVKIKTNFPEDGMSQECSRCICLSVILIDFFFKIGKKYYL